MARSSLCSFQSSIQQYYYQRFFMHATCLCQFTIPNFYTNSLKMNDIYKHKYWDNLHGIQMLFQLRISYIQNTLIQWNYTDTNNSFSIWDFAEFVYVHNIYKHIIHTYDVCAHTNSLVKINWEYTQQMVEGSCLSRHKK